MAERAASPATRSIILAPDLAELRRARHFVESVAEEAGFDEVRVFDITLLASEAAANAIEHAPVKGHVQIDCLTYLDRLEIQVAGPGEFQTPNRSNEQRARGLGLPLMAKLSDHFALYSAPEGGTLLTLTFYREGHTRPRTDSPLPPTLLEMFETTDRLEAVFGAMPEGFAIFDNEFRCIYLNDAMVVQDGRPKAAFLGHSLLSLEHGQQPLLGMFQEARARSEEVTLEFKHPHREMWSEVSVIPFAAGYAMFSRDITLRRKSEEEIRQRSLLLDLSTEAMFAWELDGRIRYWNAGAEKLYGYTQREALGSVGHDLLDTVFPETLGQFKERLRHEGEWEGELIHRHQHGQRVTVESRQQLIETEGVSLVLETDRDTTARKRAESDRKTAEHRLAEGRSLFFALLSARKAATALVRGPGLVYLYVNPAYQALRPGYDFTGRSAVEVWPQVAEEMAEVALDVLQTGESREVEAIGGWNGGQVGTTEGGRRFRSVLERVRIPGEEDWSILCTWIETTEQERTLAALREAERKLRLTLDNSRDVIFCLDARSGRYEYVSPSCESLTGYSAEELMALAPEAWLAMVHPDDVPALLDGYEKVEGSGTGTAEYRQRTRRGEYRWVSTRFSVARDERGQALYHIGSVRDVTDSKRMTEAEERLEALVSHNPSLVFLKDEEGRYVYLNDAYEKQFVHSSDWYGKTDFDFWPKESAELFLANDAQVLHAGRAGQFLEDSVDLDGNRRCWLCYKFPFTDAEGRRLVAGVGIDATARVQAEEALRESEERFRFLAKENERLYRQQLDIAERLQLALLNIPSEIGRVRVGHLYHSATETARVGGDFYDVFEVKGGLVCVLVGDVAGHGIEAARTATLVKDVVHAFTHQSVRPQEVLRRTNGLLVEKELPGFVSLFLGILDSDTGDFRYASAGHPSTFLRRVGGEVQVLGAGSPPLGVHPEATWKSGSQALEAGDLLLLYTDGVIETRRNGEYFGEKRLERLLKRKRISVERLPHIVLDQVLAFSGGELKDDVAVLALSLSGLGRASRPGLSFAQESLLGRPADG